MTFCGGKTAEGGLETEGSGVEIASLGESFEPLPLRDFLRDFIR
jgi:hypothetical protein